MAKSLTDPVAAVINYAAMSSRVLVELVPRKFDARPGTQTAPKGTTKTAFLTDPGVGSGQVTGL
jgi:hypothetical protein